ncbi:MAG: hypothetical protein FWF52_09985 [Candidatus Azobacteroides sp.]|nr:hypothetical protein [Candidatus Azobacteroides sp.]
MNSDKLTPLEVLQRKKSHLQNQFDVLANVLEADVDYLRCNIGGLLGESAIFAVASKMPPFVQGLIMRGGQEKESSGEPEKFHIMPMLKFLMEGAVNIVPFFMKGKKGIITAFLLRQAKKAFF